MDMPEEALVTTSRVAGAMNYPSTTQALFALIVMIIVLSFILVYCCWGTFTCAEHTNSSPAPENTTAESNQQHAHQLLGGSHAVIVPVNNMIYVGDPETHRIYQIPIDQDKPPAYTEVYSSCPPPPYRSNNAAQDSEVSSALEREPQRRPVVSDPPPAYVECLSDPSSTDSRASPEAPQNEQEIESPSPFPGIPQADNGTNTASLPPSILTAPKQEAPVPAPDSLGALPVNLMPREPQLIPPNEEASEVPPHTVTHN